MRYAGFWPRLFAGLIDGLVLSPILAISMWSYNCSPLVISVVSVATFFCTTAYEVYFLARYGQTIGKMICSLKVVDISGEPISLSQAFYRSSVNILLGVVGLVATYQALTNIDPNSLASAVEWRERVRIIHSEKNRLGDAVLFTSNLWFWSEFIVLLFNERKRAIHDFMAGSIVIFESKHVSNNAV